MKPIPSRFGAEPLAVSPEVDRLQAVENATGGTLPTDVVTTLASSQVPDADLIRYAKIVSRRTSVPIQDFFVPVRRGLMLDNASGPMFLDKSTGKMVSLEDARRLFKVYKRESIQALFPKLGADPKKVADVFKALDSMRGTYAEFGPLLAVVRDAVNNSDMKTLKANLDIIVKSPGLFPGDGISPLYAVIIANKAAKAGVTFKAPEDLLIYLAPEMKDAIEAQREARKRMEQDPEWQKAVKYGNPDSPEYLGPNTLYAKTYETVVARGDLYVSSFFGGDQVLGALLNAIGNDEQDYIKVGKELMAQAQNEAGLGAALNEFKDPGNLLEVLKSKNPFAIAAMSVAFVGAWVATGVVKTLDYASRLTQALERFAFDPTIGFLYAGQKHSFDAKAFREATFDAWDIITGRTTAAEELADEGIPGWLYFAADITAGFLIDPLVFGGKFLAGRNIARLLPRAKSAEAWVALGLRVYSEEQNFGRVIGKTSIPGAFVKAALAEEDAASMTMRINALLRRKFLGPGAHPALVSTIYDYVREAKAAGRTVEDLTQDVRELFYMAHGIHVEDTAPLAARVRQAFEDAQLAADTELPIRLRGVEASDEALNAQALAAVKALDDYGDLVSRVGLLDVEIPQVAGRLSASRLASRFERSKLMDTEWGRAARALFVTAPRRGPNEFYIAIDAPDLPKQLTSIARRSRLYSNDEVARIEMDVARFMDRQMPLREAEFKKWLENFNDSMLKRLGKTAGASEEQTKRLVEMLKSRLRARDRRVPTGSLTEQVGGVFGVVPGPAPLKTMQVFTEPVFSTQLQNEFSVLDPLIVRQGFNSVMGTVRQTRNFLLRGLGKEVPEFARGIPGLNRSGEITNKTLRIAMERVFDLAVRDLFLTWWKPLVVIRPAYVMRVVGMEEQARFVATSSLLERIKTTKTGARLLKPSEVKYGKRGVSLLFEAPPGTEAAAVERLFSNEPGVVIDAVGDGTFRVFRPFRAAAGVGEAAYADTTATAVALAGERGPLGNAILKRKGAKVDFDPIVRPDEALNTLRRGVNSKSAEKQLAKYLNGWVHALNYQFAKDPIGNLLLRHIAQGMDRDESARAVVAAINAEQGSRGQLWSAATRLLGKVDPSSAQVDDAIEAMMTVLDEYTMNRTADIATHALSGGLSVGALRKTIVDPAFDMRLLPQYLHGPELEMILASDGPLKRAGKRYSDAILRAPTNHFSRRPYARSWEKAYKDAAYALREQTGVALTTDVKAAIDVEAQQFARQQVDRIMFDYTRQARFAEALEWVFPFLGPYMEQFQVWGRIIRQNPAVVGYVRRGYEAAKESGFLREDENGELTVPLSNWLGTSTLLGWFFGQPGWRLSAPAANFNQFFQTSIPIRVNGQEIPLLAPGMGPNIQFLVQQFLNSSIAEKVDPEILSSISGYVMRYGPITPESLIPPYLRNFISGVSGLATGDPWLQGDAENRYVSGFLRDYAKDQFVLQDGTKVGLTAENLVRYPDLAEQVAGQEFKNEKDAGAWLADRARRDVSALFAWRALMNMFFPAAPAVEMPSAEWERELRLLRDDPKYANDYTALQEEWLSRHPDGMIYLVSKTMSDDLQNGAFQPLASNEMANRLLQGVGAKKFAREHPGWVWAIIPREMRQKSDLASFFRNLSMGLLRTRPAEETLQLVSERQGWNEYRAIRAAWQAWMDSHPDADPNDPDYERNQAILFDRPVAALRTRNPWWGAAFSTWEEQGINYEIIEQAHVLSKDKLFSQTQLGQALREFLPAFDRLRNVMSSEAIANITDKSAGALGLTEEWNTLLTDLKERYPDFATWVALYDIDQALTQVQSDTDSYLASLPEAEAARIEADYDEYRDQIGLPGEVLDDISERSQAYNGRAPLVNRLYSEYAAGKTPMHLWWNNLTPTVRLSYVQSWSAYPIQWLDRFQKEQLGIASDDATEATFAAYNDAVATIEEKYLQGELTRQQRSSYYKSLEAQMAEREKTNPVLARQVAISNTWSYRFFAANKNLLDSQNPAAEEWGLLKDASQMIMRAVYAADIYGREDYGDAERGWYNRTYQALIDYVETELYDNPIFQQQWDHYVEAYGGVELMRQFMPEFTGTFGSGSYLTDWP